jgi:hypothetical protein
MSITLQAMPNNYSPVHNRVVYTFDSTNKAQVNFKYVVDVYVSGVKVATLKPAPNPSNNNFGSVDVGPILRSYVNSNYFRGCKTFLGPVAPAGKYFVSYDLKIGEEYGTPPTTYINMQSYVGMRAVNAALTFEDLLPVNITNPNDTYVSSWLTNRPQPVADRLSLNDVAYINFYNRASYTAIGYQIKKYSASGTLAGTINAAPAADTDTFLMEIGYGPANINGSYPGFIDSNVSYYTVSVTLDGSITKTLTVVLDCFKKFEGFNVTFLNRPGGYDTKTFKFKNSRTASVDRKSYGQQGYTFSSGGSALTGYDSRGNFFSVPDGGVYGVKDRQKFKLTTDFLTEKESIWLFELIASPIIYLHYPDKNGTIFHLPVKITADNYQFLKPVNDKLTPLEIEVEVLRTYNSQFI